MEKLNELVELAKKARFGHFDYSRFTAAIEPETILAIAEAFRALEQRAEAAEAKLAEFEKQEPRYQVQKVPSYGRESLWIDVASREEAETNVLHGYRWRMVYDAPAPAINLAELVPCEIDNWENPASEVMRSIGYVGSKQDFTVGANWMRAAMLRNIEEENNAR